ncbi:hypothetical protein ACFLRU_02670 [Bacteroidota bacterium]
MRKEIDSFTSKANNMGFFTPFKQLLKKTDSLYILPIDNPKKTDSIYLNLKKTNDLPPYLLNQKNDSITLSTSKLRDFINELNKYHQQTGKVFTKIKIENIVQINNNIKADLIITNKTPRKIDKIIFEGYATFPSRYNKHYLKLLNKPFNKNVLKTTDIKLKKLAFISQEKKPEVLFTKDSTILYLYIKRKRLNLFDGLIGFSNKDNGNKIRFNGHLHLELNNSFNKGEKISFKWLNNGNNIEQLNLQLNSPFIFNSPINSELSLNIKKQDSSFINTRSKLLLNYYINHNNIFGITTAKEKSTSSLTIPTNDINSYTKTNYGLSYTYSLYNDTSSRPKTKIIFQLDKGIKTTNSTNENQLHYYIQGLQHVKLTQRTSLFLQTTFEELKGNNILQNETYFIGGANTVRGFNENSIQATRYNYTNIEYQIKTANSSYLYTFSDLSLVQNKPEELKDTLYSLGFGYNYKTLSGFINLSYAFGKTDKTEFNFQKGIFHIKLISFF